MLARELSERRIVLEQPRPPLLEPAMARAVLRGAAREALELSTDWRGIEFAHQPADVL